MRIDRRAVKRWLKKINRRQNKQVWVPALVIIFTVVLFKAFNSPQPTRIDPQAYAPLLSTIAHGESRGNYNAYYGNAGNAEIKFTEMTVGEVMAWQQDFVQRGSPSSAVGKYQFIRPTLAGLVNEMNIGQSEIFNENLQDRMAIRLIERRGSVDYVEKKLSREDFAASIAKEWAALPKVKGENPDQSYYAGDGLNKAHITIDEILGALDSLANIHKQSS